MKRLKKKANIQDVLYHATFNCNHNYVYLATDQDVAESYCESAEDVDDDVYDSGIIVLKIDTSKLDENKFIKDPNLVLDEEDLEETIAYNGIIQPSAIKL